MPILRFDLERSIFDLEVKNSKFRRITFLRFQHSPIKTVGGVRKSTKKCLKMTSFWPGTEKRKIAQPRNLYPDATFTPIHLLVKFRDDRTSGKWSKSPDRRTDALTDIE